MPFTNVTITGNFHDPNGKALNGTIEALLSGVMQNGVCTTSPKVIKAKITNGTTSFTLKANDDPGTLPENRLYTFKITIAGGPKETFKVRVPHEPGSIDIAELRRKSGIVGEQPEGRPVLNQHSSNQAIVEALAFLELVTENPLSFASGSRGPQLTGPQGEEGPPGPPGPPGGGKARFADEFPWNTYNAFWEGLLEHEVVVLPGTHVHLLSTDHQKIVQYHYSVIEPVGPKAEIEIDLLINKVSVLHVITTETEAFHILETPIILHDDDDLDLQVKLKEGSPKPHALHFCIAIEHEVEVTPS